MAAKYYKSPENDRSGFRMDNDIRFVARSDAPRPTHWGSTEYPTAEIHMDEGFYDYGSIYGHDTSAIRHNVWAKPGDQLKLIGIIPSKITEAFSDYAMRSHTPAVLGMAINEAKKIGTGLTYDADLSEHSAKLVRRGIEAGVLIPNPINPKGEQSNDLAYRGLDNYENTYNDVWFDQYEPVSDAEVNAGRETTHELIKKSRQARKEHMGPQFNKPEGWYQPELGE